jgi:hypothetical protein
VYGAADCGRDREPRSRLPRDGGDTGSDDRVRPTHPGRARCDPGGCQSSTVTHEGTNSATTDCDAVYCQPCAIALPNARTDRAIDRDNHTNADTSLIHAHTVRNADRLSDADPFRDTGADRDTCCVGDACRLCNTRRLSDTEYAGGESRHADGYPRDRAAAFGADARPLRFANSR